MSLGTIASIKDSALGYTPLFLCAFQFQLPPAPDQATLYLATHPFNTSEGTFDFPGVGNAPAGAYLGRLQEQNFTAFQLRSQTGIDRTAQVTLSIADADAYIWSNYASEYGFRGATLWIYFVLWQPGTGNFSTDAPLLFLGTCDTEIPVQGGNAISVTAIASNSTQRVFLPNVPIQNRCPWSFPANAAQRADGLSNPLSPYYQCGYSPDQAGGVGNTGPVFTGVLATDLASGAVDAYGNQITDTSGNYVMCDYLRSNSNDPHSGCMPRLGNAAATGVAPDGDISHDQGQSGLASSDLVHHLPHQTGHFGGITFNPGTYYAIERNYTTGQKAATFSFQNSAILGQYQNLLYGSQFVNPKIANIVETAGDTRCEAMICSGSLGPTKDNITGGSGSTAVSTTIPIVLVDGIQVPVNGADGSFRWEVVSCGTRIGGLNADAGYSAPGYSATGDPYGNITCIEIAWYSEIETGSGLPSIQVLVQGIDPGILGNSSFPASGPYLTVFSDTTTSFQGGFPYNHNPAWVVLDLLARANWTVTQNGSDQIDIQSFIDAAAFCYGPTLEGAPTSGIPYINDTGDLAYHDRFKCQFSLESKKTAGEVIQMVLKSFNGYLVKDPASGLLQLQINQTLADSQPSPITGSNYNTAVASIHADDAPYSDPPVSDPGNGYVAYSFDESSIARKTDGTFDLEFLQNPTSQCPTEVIINFQDEDNGFVTDSLTNIDSVAAQRATGSYQPGAGIIQDSFSVLGIPNMDQATRISNVYMAERSYGNELEDARGTRIVKFRTTYKVEHLRVGHIVFFSNHRLGVTKQLCRVIEILPTTDYEAASITLQYHVDEWYTDAYGQAPLPFIQAAAQGSNRVPLPWQPYGTVPESILYGDTAWNFTLAEVDSLQSNGLLDVQLQVSGAPPINQVINSAGGVLPTPAVPTQAMTSSTGGSIAGGKSYMLQVCGVDSSGNYSLGSNIIASTVPTGTNTNTITIPDVYFPAGTATYDVFCGSDHFNITHQATGTATGPVTMDITLTSLPNTLTYGPPDLAAYQINVQAKSVAHAGIIGELVSAITTTGITIGAPASGTLQSLAGYYVMLIGRPNLAGAPLPIIDFQITSNVSNVLTLDRDPIGLLQIEDVVVICAQANISSATTIGDANFVSPYAPTGVSPAPYPAGDQSAQVRIIAGTGRGQYRTISAVTGPDSTYTTYTVSSPWRTIPDTTSLFIVEDPSFRYFTSTIIQSSPLVPSSDQPVFATVDFANYAGETVLVQAITYNATGTLSSVPQRSPYRIYYLLGTQGTRIVTDADATMLPTDALVKFVGITANRTYTCLPFSSVPNQLFQIVRQASVSGTATVTVQAVGSDDFQGGGNALVLTDDTSNYQAFFKVPAS